MYQTRRRSVFIIFALAGLGVIALDQLTKHLVMAHLLLYQSIPLSKGWLNLVYVHNTGVAFGFFAGPNTFPKTLFFSGLTLIAVVVVLYFLWQAAQRRDGLQAVFLGMICGGAMGNLIDRFSIGAVIDFIDVYYKRYHWPAFNVADAAISVGVVLLILQLILKGSRGSEKAGQDAPRSVPNR